MIHQVKGLARNNNDKDATILLADGSDGINATTNIVVRKACYKMLFMVYGALALLCFITFRSWRALMVGLGMGVKVSTLARMREGATLKEAYATAMQFTGRVVLLTGVTLAAAVVTWHFSSIKFQADMGLLLAFMFLLNMIGALVLMPALAHFLLPGAREGLVAEQINAAAQAA
ncbi:MMPL family transporter [Polaromonas glacialis]|uniref:MMPL family transporter n=1 Tax=Polaromonas glacialis TaxID=866564 RepID=UPI000495D23B